jgi:hypothetical protein
MNVFIFSKNIRIVILLYIPETLKNKKKKRPNFFAVVGHTSPYYLQLTAIIAASLLLLLLFVWQLVDLPTLATLGGGRGGGWSKFQRQLKKRGFLNLYI